MTQTPSGECRSPDVDAGRKRRSALLLRYAGRRSLPLAIDLYCGLGGWTDGLLAEGWDVVGFDIEQHAYGEHRYPAQLVLQDVLTLHGSQFRNADLIVASPPCQKYSYMAMPWKRSKALAAWYREDEARQVELNALFNACFRIQREACEAAGRHIPLIVENVRGAQPWVGRARFNYGSFYLWGDVPALMPRVLRPAKQDREVLNKDGHNVILPQVVYREGDGRKAPAGTAWFNDAPRTKDALATMGGKSPARKAASAMIAKIPEPLARFIARTFKPQSELQEAA